MAANSRLSDVDARVQALLDQESISPIISPIKSPDIVDISPVNKQNRGRKRPLTKIDKFKANVAKFSPYARNAWRKPQFPTDKKIPSVSEVIEEYRDDEPEQKRTNSTNPKVTKSTDKPEQKRTDFTNPKDKKPTDKLDSSSTDKQTDSDSSSINSDSSSTNSESTAPISTETKHFIKQSKRMTVYLEEMDKSSDIDEKLTFWNNKCDKLEKELSEAQLQRDQLKNEKRKRGEAEQLRKEILEKYEIKKKHSRLGFKPGLLQCARNAK